MTQCRSCGAPVRWVQTEYGRRMPLDAEPYTGSEPGGRFIIRGATAIAAPPDAFPDEPQYLCHFATCPQADEWRWPRASAPPAGERQEA